MIAGSAEVFEPGHPRRYHRTRGSRSGIRSHDLTRTVHDVIQEVTTLALTRRGRLVVSVVGALALVAVGGIALALTGHAPAVIQEAVDNVTGQSHAPEPPPTCPLTGTPAPARRGPSPAGAGRQGREHARRVPARRPPERRRRLRGARRGRHHALHGALPVQGRQAGRAGPERAHHGSEGVDPVRPALGDRVLGRPARRASTRSSARGSSATTRTRAATRSGATTRGTSRTTCS